MFQIDVCRRCLTTEALPDWRERPAQDRRKLQEIPLHGGAFMLRLCADCAKVVTIAEVNRMVAEHDWQDKVTVNVTVTVTHADGARLAEMFIFDPIKKWGDLGGDSDVDRALSDLACAQGITWTIRNPGYPSRASEGYRARVRAPNGDAHAAFTDQASAVVWVEAQLRVKLDDAKG